MRLSRLRHKADDKRIVKAISLLYMRRRNDEDISMKKEIRVDISRRELLSTLGLAATVLAAPKLVYGAGAVENAAIDLNSLHGSGVYRTRLQHALPDRHGVHLQREVNTSDIDSAVAYAGQWWPAGGNRVYPKVLARMEDVPEGTLFLLLRKKSGTYLAVLPLADAESYAWFSGDGSALKIKLGTLGRATLNGEKNLFAWAEAASAYEAIAEAWKRGLDGMKSVSLRESKKYPEIFEYLGWCSWEAFGTEINEQKMAQTVKDIEESGVPIRYFLMDEGHADNQTLTADMNKFPNGYTALTGLKKPEKVRWFGLWWGMLGAAHGVKAPGKLGALSDAMMLSGDGVLVPKPNAEDAARFFDHIVDESKAGGFDFVKVDFMVDALPLYAGMKEAVPTLGGLPPDNREAISNPYAAAAMVTRICEERVAVTMQGMMNCNWHNAACLFNSGTSVVGRCSEDYKSNDLARAKAHLYHAFSAMPWLGQTAWGDHDMFHSSDKAAAREMAISKAISGGPIYLSDEPQHFVKELIAPLCYGDGRLLRPAAPGAPVEEDIFYAPDSGKLMRVIAPLKNNCAAIVVFHLEGGNAKLSTQIEPKHYQQAAEMMQPFRGEWPVPQEDLLIYEWDRKIATKLNGRYEISMSGFGVTLLQISPIQHGWSIIGRADKYLAAEAVSNIEYERESLRLRVEEGGTLVVWSDMGPPRMNGAALREIGKDLFAVDVAKNAGVIFLQR
jgi:hypothetical protein